MLKLYIKKVKCGPKIAHHVYFVETHKPSVARINDSYAFNNALIETCYFEKNESEEGIEVVSNPIERLKLHLELNEVYTDISTQKLKEMIEEKGWYSLLAQIKKEFDLDILLMGDTLIHHPIHGYFNSNFGWVADAESADGFHEPEGNASDYLIENVKDVEWVTF